MDTSPDKVGEPEVTVYTCRGLSTTEPPDRICFSLTGCKGGPETDVQMERLPGLPPGAFGY